MEELTKEEYIAVLEDIIKRSERDLTCVEEEMTHAGNEMVARAGDYTSLVKQRDIILERKLKTEEELKRATEA
jgi:hypothetical protein